MDKNKKSKFVWFGGGFSVGAAATTLVAWAVKTWFGGDSEDEDDSDEKDEEE